MPRGRRLTAKGDEMAALVAGGERIGDVARKFDVSPSTVSVACKRRGVVGSALPGYHRTKRCDDMAEMIKSGATLKATAEAFGVSPPAVHKACKLRGVNVKQYRWKRVEGGQPCQQTQSTSIAVSAPSTNQKLPS